MKNVILGVVLFFTSIGICTSANVDVNVGAATDYVYRGESVTDGKPTVFGNLKFNDVVFDNTYVSVGAVLLNATPVDDAGDVRSDIGVGYEWAVSDAFVVDAGLFRVFNPNLSESNYNEGRLDLGYALTDNVSVFGRSGYKFSQDVTTDVYAGLGLKVNNLFVDNLNVSGLISTARDEFNNNFEFNNVELTAEYMLLKGLYAFGTYSVGGATVRDAFDTEINFDARNIPSTGLVGVRYSF